MSVFETGALPVRLTLRAWNLIQMNLSLNYQTSPVPFMPQVGVEPTPARFLRPPPLPLGYCGALLQCSEQDSNLHVRDSHSRRLCQVGLPELGTNAEF